LLQSNIANGKDHSMTRFLIITSACALFTMNAGHARAWNSIGHMTVAKLAYDQLDQKHQLALFRLLQSHPHYKEFLAAGRPADIENEVQWVVLRSSYWSDWIRPRKRDNRGNVSKYHRGEEHYVNIPIIDPKDEAFFAGKTLINPDLPNIVTALRQRANDLKTKTAAAEDRAVAVCWLFHLVGDIHQPMHNVSYFSNTPAFLGGDLGGNKFAIKADGRQWKLHAFWDDLLGVDRDYSDDSGNHQAALYREAVRLAEGLRGLKLTAADEEKLAKHTTFESWSREGFELARKVAYRKGDGSGMLKAVEARYDGQNSDDVEEVGKQYIANARATAEKQVVLAGRRLAERLKVLVQP
jgi:hypothetical protein